MVEGGKIDNYSHKNDLDNMLKEFWDFDMAVAVALAYAMQNPDTTVIVTADHETGWPKLPKEWSEENINDSCSRAETTALEPFLTLFLTW